MVFTILFARLIVCLNLGHCRSLFDASAVVPVIDLILTRVCDVFGIASVSCQAQLLLTP